MSVCPTCGQTIIGTGSIIDLLRMPCPAPAPKKGFRPIGVRDVYRGNKTQLAFVTYGGGGPWPWQDVLKLARSGALVRTYPECADSFTLPGNEWRETRK